MQSCAVGKKEEGLEGNSTTDFLPAPSLPHNECSSLRLPWFLNKQTKNILETQDTTGREKRD